MTIEDYYTGRAIMGRGSIRIPSGLRRSRDLNPQERERFYSLYNAGESTVKIAAALNRHFTTLRKWMDLEGLPRGRVRKSNTTRKTPAYIVNKHGGRFVGDRQYQETKSEPFSAVIDLSEMRRRSRRDGSYFDERQG